MKVGIEAISYYLPNIYLPIEVLAEARNIEADKLKFGLGLQGMSFPDQDEDVISMALNAVEKLFLQEKLNPKDIHRIYVGSESGLDSSKPIGSYIVANLEEKLGKGTLEHCDTVDLTFACIGGVDALLNCADFIRLNPNKKAIVITTDFAKYELESTGEYTQGAGAIALLITSNPSIIALEKSIGISTEGVFDFFKPKRYFQKLDILEDDSLEIVSENEIAIHKEQPVFDGQYSNQCYIQRIKNAYANYCKESNSNELRFKKWEHIYMHLPYCFQGRRTFIEIYAETQPELLKKQAGETKSEKIKNLSKSKEYKKLIDSKIYPSEIASGLVGNLYTGSVFLGMISALCHSFSANKEIKGKKVGFIAYGSGSKSKVFEGKIQENWHSKVKSLDLFSYLENRTKLTIKQYDALYKKELKQPISKEKKGYFLSKIEKEDPVLIGARYYQFDK